MSDGETEPIIEPPIEQPGPSHGGDRHKHLLELVRQKRNSKRNTTKVKYQVERLLTSIPKTEPEIQEVEYHIQYLWDSLEEFQVILDEMCACYLDLKDNEGQARITKESEEFEFECQEVIDKAQAAIIAGASLKESHTAPSSEQEQPTEPPVENGAANNPPESGSQVTDGHNGTMGQVNNGQDSGPPNNQSVENGSGASESNDSIPTEGDSTKKPPPAEKSPPSTSPSVNARLKPLKVPTFDGNKSRFEEYWALFESLVDKSSEPVNLKMARLRQSLTGSALDSIRGLGVSEPEYKEAKAILKTKFGGQRRQLRAYLDELEKMPTLRANDVKGFERFADLVRVTVVKLQAEGREGELGDGTLHSMLVKKLTDRHLEGYTRWITEHKQEKSVTSLREWLKEKVAIRVEAAEMAHGLEANVTESTGSHKSRYHEKSKTRTFFTTSGIQQRQKAKPPCVFCGGVSHGVWNCRAFQQKSVEERWNFAKEKKLCFRCLSGDHHGKDCRRSQPCNVNGCSLNHHRLLYRSSSTGFTTSSVATPNTANGSGSVTQFTQSAPPWSYPTYPAASQGSFMQSPTPMSAQAPPWERVQKNPAVSMTTRNPTHNPT